MSFSILLDSAIAKQQNKNQNSHDFTIRFDEPIVLDKNKNYKAALNDVVTMSYSWYNVRAVYGNNTLRWKKKSKRFWKTITLPDGMYNYETLSCKRNLERRIQQTKSPMNFSPCFLTAPFLGP